MLSERLEKVKGWLAENRKDLLTAAFIFLMGLGSFGLGRLSVIWPEKEPITITDGDLTQNTDGGTASAPAPAGAGTAAISNAPVVSAKGKYVASKSGAYYHFPWCSGALRIKDANKIWFQTKQEAEVRGLKPAANCPGL